jgi:hypothetical protein
VQLIRQSTAKTFRIGPFVDAADGFTAETGLTLSQADFRLSKNGAAFAQKNETTSATHDENGWYTCILDTTDTNTLGPLTIAVNESGARPVYREFMVVTAAIYDGLVATGGALGTASNQVTISNNTVAIFNRIGAPIGASISADLQVVDTVADAIKAKTDNLPASPAAAGDIPSAADIAEAVLESEIAVADDVSAAGTPTVRRRLRQLWQDNVKR